MPGIAAFLGLALPLSFWLCRWQGWPFWCFGLALLPIALGLIWGRARHALLSRSARVALGVAAAMLGGMAFLRQSEQFLFYYPVCVNLFFFLVFAMSLTRKQSLIEHLARRMEPDLSAAGVRYTKKVTQAWCVFFALNGAIAWWSVGAGGEVWSLYNGGIAYLLMGLMFAGEWLIRRHVKRKHSAA
ncbi:MAG: hypothetical protein LBB51_06005 [Zoogloeaceae bacterium]|jgi:uncharacterized membrane protein|nr:hypothetical protein [Zoogloeaceae bacterium]